MEECCREENRDEVILKAGSSGGEETGAEDGSGHGRARAETHAVGNRAQKEAGSGQT